MESSASRKPPEQELDSEIWQTSDFGCVPQSWTIETIGAFTKLSQYGLSLRGSGTGRYPILRMNCQEAGQVVLRDLQYVDIDDTTFNAFRLWRGDLLFNRTNSYELVGRVAMVEDDLDAVFASYLVRLSLDQTRLLPAYLNYFLNWEIAQSELKKLASRAVGQANINATKLSQFRVPVPPLDVQHLIAQVLDAGRSALEIARTSEEKATDLKRAAMRDLFTRGLRGGPQRETEIGPVPENWGTLPLEDGATIYSSSRLNYGELLARENDDQSDDAVSVLGIKVIDMTRCEAEASLSQAELSRKVNRSEAANRCIPPGAIVFPKNGAAVATNKKRRVADWCVLDPNVMALHATDCIEQAYLFHWIQSFDLKSIVKPGPVPNFGKGDISRVLIPVPPTLDEQREIVTILEAIDRKIDLHRKKRAVLDELFKALLHKLMTGEIRVGDLDLSTLAPARVAEAAQ